MAIKQQSLFPKDIPGVFLCQSCGLLTAHFCLTLVPLKIQCNECGDIYNEDALDSRELEKLEILLEDLSTAMYYERNKRLVT